MKQKTMKVLFTGITGINKKEYIDNIIMELGKENAILYRIEEGTEGHLWQIESANERKILLKKRWDDVKDKISNSTKKYQLIDFHCTTWKPCGFQYDHFYIREKIKEIKPDLILVLIDNITSIKWRLRSKFEYYMKKNNLEEATEPSKLGLRDIIMWRENEITFSYLLADSLFQNINTEEVKHIYIVAREHKPKMIADLIENYELKKKCYIAFPVRILRTLKESSQIKKCERIKKSIEFFKNKLEEKYIVFDPYTIYEKEIEELLIDCDPERVAEDFTKFFLTECKQPRKKTNIFGKNFFPEQESQNPEYFSLNIWEIAQVLRDINAQIRERDSLFVDQTDFVIAFTPEESFGARAEIGWSLKYHNKAFALIDNDVKWDEIMESAKEINNIKDVGKRDIFDNIWEKEASLLKKNSQNSNKSIVEYTSKDKILKVYLLRKAKKEWRDMIWVNKNIKFQEIFDPDYPWNIVKEEEFLRIVENGINELLIKE